MDVREQFLVWMTQWEEARKSFAASEVVKEAAVAEAPISANPIQASTIGMDQDVHDPKSLDATYDVADLENLETLRVKLHDLLSKLSAMESKGDAKLEAKIVDLQNKIDEFSNSLGVQK